MGYRLGVNSIRFGVIVATSVDCNLFTHSVLRYFLVMFGLKDISL